MLSDPYITCFISVYADAMRGEGVEVQVSLDLQFQWGGVWVQQVHNVNLAWVLRE